jgi:endonuclease/exonuclease/phosphatase family metal-dependent hydrolase
MSRAICILLASISLTTLLDAAPLELTFASYNIRYENKEDRAWRSWPDRLQRLVATIRRMNPDVLGVQEALHAQVADLRLSLTDYEFYGVGRDDGRKQGEYSGIFFRRQRLTVDPSDAGTFWLSDTPQQPGSMTWGNRIPRISTWLHLRDNNSGRGITVFNTHWDHIHQGSREKAAALISQRIDVRIHRDEPVVLLGDFNATEGNSAVDLLAGRIAGWSHSMLDTYQRLHAGEKDRRTLHFWKNNKDGWAKVDHILASKPCQIIAAEIGYPAVNVNPASDHFPVFSRVSWP